MIQPWEYTKENKYLVKVKIEICGSVLVDADNEDDALLEVLNMCVGDLQDVDGYLDYEDKTIDEDNIISIEKLEKEKES